MEKTTFVERITLLLVDDAPSRYYNHDVQGIDFAGDTSYEDVFQLLWIPRAPEARAVLQYIDHLQNRARWLLRGAGLPPGIIIFDYALTGPPKWQQAAASPCNILTRLRSTATRVGEPTEITCEAVPVTPETRGADSWGCYVGVAFARAFADFPCASVPTTRHREGTRSIDARFVEWFNAPFMRGLFKYATRDPDIIEWINIGVQTLRERLIELSRSGVVQPEVCYLERMMSAPDECINAPFIFACAYGRVRWPMRGLFADSLMPIPRVMEYRRDVEDWAKRMIEALFRGGSTSDDNHTIFRNARRLAAEYYGLWRSGESNSRYWLAHLLNGWESCSKPAERRVECLKEVCQSLGFDSDLVVGDGKTIVRRASEIGARAVPHCAKGEGDAARRWAILFLCVYAEFEYSENRKADLLNDDEAKEACRSRWRSVRELVFEMVDPIPESLATFYYDRQSGNTLDVAISRLLRAGSSEGERITVARVLGGSNGNGLQRGDGRILRLFAEEIRFDSSYWPAWLESAP